MIITERRKELGISQKELAEKCEITQQFLCDIEKGRCNPSLQTAVKLAAALGIKEIGVFNSKNTPKQ